MNSLPDEEWRFDRVIADHLWAACIWEYCREYVRSLPKPGLQRLRRIGGMCGTDNAATLGAATMEKQFPEVPWLRLPVSDRNRLSRRWRYAPGDLEDYSEMDLICAVDPRELRSAFHRVGRVVFDLGPAPIAPKNVASDRVTSPGSRPTRAELIGRFEAWVDAHPEWWDGRGRRGARRGAAGKRDPNDGLRALAWTRLRSRNSSDGKVEEIVKGARAHPWLGGILSAERTRKFPSEATAWMKLVCKA